MTPDKIIKKSKDLSRRQPFDFNCWAFTALALGWLSHVHWFNETEMELLLKFYTIQVKDLQPGDVIVYRSKHKQWLIHTCIWLGLPDAEVVNKSGRFPIEFTSMKEVDDVYEWCECTTEFRRPV